MDPQAVRFSFFSVPSPSPDSFPDPQTSFLSQMDATYLSGLKRAELQKLAKVCCVYTGGIYILNKPRNIK